MSKKKIGILTSGGDCPGLNAVIRGVVRKAEREFGWRTLGYTILLSGIAVVLGLVMVNLLKPGAGVDPAAAQEMLAESADRAQAIVRDSTEQPSGMQMLLDIVPQNVIGAASSNA